MKFKVNARTHNSSAVNIEVAKVHTPSNVVAKTLLKGQVL